MKLFRSIFQAKAIFVAIAVTLAIFSGTRIANAGAVVEYYNTTLSTPAWQNLAGVGGTNAQGTSGLVTSTLPGGGGGLLVSPNPTLQGVLVSFAALTSNWQGTAALTTVTGATVSLTNNSGSAQTLTFLFGVSGFTAPTGTAAMAVGVSSSAPIGVANTVSATSYVNLGSNGSGGIAGDGGLTGQSATVTLTGTSATGSNSPATFVTGLSASNGFAINEVVTVTIAAGAQINFSVTTQLNPEPASMTLLVLGALGMAGYGLRRRRQAGRNDEAASAVA